MPQAEYLSWMASNLPGPDRWITWSECALGWSIGIVKFSLMAAAPREPPKTSTTGRSGVNAVPRVALMRARASAFDAGTSSSRDLRSGSPVTSEGQRSVSALTAGNDSASPAATRLNTRLDLPMRALPSCR